MRVSLRRELRRAPLHDLGALAAAALRGRREDLEAGHQGREIRGPQVRALQLRRALPEHAPRVAAHVRIAPGGLGARADDVESSSGAARGACLHRARRRLLRVPAPLVRELARLLPVLAGLVAGTFGAWAAQYLGPSLALWLGFPLLGAAIGHVLELRQDARREPEARTGAERGAPRPRAGRGRDALRNRRAQPDGSASGSASWRSRSPSARRPSRRSSRGSIAPAIARQLDSRLLARSPQSAVRRARQRAVSPRALPEGTRRATLSRTWRSPPSQIETMLSKLMEVATARPGVREAHPEAGRRPSRSPRSSAAVCAPSCTAATSR